MQREDHRPFGRASELTWDVDLVAILLAIEDEAAMQEARLDLCNGRVFWAHPEKGQKKQCVEYLFLQVHYMSS